MTKTHDEIKSGIMFEEDIVHLLAEDIKLMHGYAALPGSVQEKIQGLLQRMIEDSLRHKSLLQRIVDVY